MSDRFDALAIVDRALGFAEGDEADAVFNGSDRNLTRFASSTIHQNLSERGGSLTIRVVANARIGVASTSATDDDALRRTAALALDLAKRSEPVEGFRGLHRNMEPSPGIDAFDEATARISLMQKAEDLAAVFAAGAKVEVTYAGTYTTGVGEIAVGNTHGVRHSARVTVADALVIAMRGSQSGFATRMSRGRDGVRVRELGTEATETCSRLTDRTAELGPGRYDVILEPAAIAEAFEWLNMIAFSGQSYEDGSSFFVGKLGKKTLGENVTIVDDPIDADFLPFPFDLEGMPKRRVALIEKGVPGTPALDTIAASRLGLEPTASAISLEATEHGMALHLSMSGGTSSREEMIASTERGVWVTRFNYVNGLLDPKTALMTGMTRDGTFLVENGKVTARLPNLRWTQSMVEALNNVEALSRERRIVGTWWNPVGGTIAPTLKVRGWNVTGAQG
jgi:predicted Zn-dependent protease